MQPEESRYDRGLAMMRTIFGPSIESALKGLASTSPDLARCLVEGPFGAVYPRPGLDLKTREMLTVAALTVLGYPQGELKEHIRGALNVGCTRDEIVEIILQMAVYAGFPAALEAAKTAAGVFEEPKRDESSIHEEASAGKGSSPRFFEPGSGEELKGAQRRPSAG